MEKEVASTLGYLILGAFFGWAYFSLLMIFWGAFFIGWDKAQKSEKWKSIIAATFFSPAVGLAILGLYGVYSLLVGDMPVWFAIGTVWPVVSIAVSSIKGCKDKISKQ